MREDLSITIVEDDLLVRAGIEALLDTIAEVSIRAVCDDLDQALSSIETSTPDVVLTDIRLPPSMTDEGMRLAERLRRTHPDVGVVVLSAYIDPQLALAIFEGGSSRRAYLLKARLAEVEHLVEAIRSVAAGRSFIDDEVIDALVAARSGDDADPLGSLTERELEVLGEMATGRSNAAIAERLFVGERAVEKHISSILTKLELPEDPSSHRRVAAVLLYLNRNARAGTSD